MNRDRMLSSARRMNHYEELGIPRSASLAEIRLAYKTLVRVLHPDQQQDENLRRLSELQLRRLNHILEVLSDPGQRLRYDLSLDRLVPADRFQQVPPQPRKVPVAVVRSGRLRLHENTGMFVWLLIAAIALGSIVVWIRSPEPAYLPVAKRGSPSSSTPDLKEPASKDFRPPQKGHQPPEPPVAQVSAESVQPPGARHRASADIQTSAVIEAPVQTPAVVENAPAPIPAGPSRRPQLTTSAPETGPDVSKPVEPPLPALKPPNSISGKWLYVPKPDDNKNLYQAEYIELRISSGAGLLRGNYRGKYRVPDRAISSEINFQFEGKQGDSVSLLPWYSSNGSKGELRVKRLSDEKIEVNWITTSFGNSNTLASGTAVLYRSDAP